MVSKTGLLRCVIMPFFFVYFLVGCRLTFVQEMDVDKVELSNRSEYYEFTEERFRKLQAGPAYALAQGCFSIYEPSLGYLNSERSAGWGSTRIILLMLSAFI